MNGSSVVLVANKPVSTVSGGPTSDASMTVGIIEFSTQGTVQEKSVDVSMAEQRITKNRADIEAGKAAKYGSVEEYINSLKEDKE